MASYSETEREMLRGTPIDRILASFGRDTKHGNNNMYYSPFRSETTPSFHVDPKRNVWYDFGTGESGSSVTLVCMILKCNGGKAYDYLASLGGTAMSHDMEPGRQARPAASAHGIRVLETRDAITDPRLITYAQSRGIGPKVLGRWCSEVLYTLESKPEKRFTAIGFRNDRGGWVLRSQPFKGCTSSGITTIDIYGDRPGECASASGLIFEGFFDFLSFMELRGSGWPECDICILNSTVNIKKSVEWAREHATVGTFFDCDETGRAAFTELGRLCAERGGRTSVTDWSGPYSGHGDLNARFMQGPRERDQLTLQYQELWKQQFQRKFRTA